MIKATLLLGTVIAILIGALAHLITNGGIRTLLAYIILSIFGFWGGHFVGVLWNFLPFGRLGTLYLLTAILGSLLFLIFGYFAKININKIED